MSFSIPFMVAVRGAWDGWAESFVGMYGKHSMKRQGFYLDGSNYSGL